MGTKCTEPGPPGRPPQASGTPRGWQALLIATFVPASWLWMMVVHELGHVLGAWLTGGTVAQVSLPTVGFSSTMVDPNPRPLTVTWMGPVVGVALPVAAWGVAAATRAPGRLLLRWFAGFCAIANGAYLGVGWIDGVGDAGDLVRHGAAVWQLVLFGVAAFAGGLALWHGTGEAFGLGAARGRVSRAAAVASAIVLLLTVAFEIEAVRLR